MTLHYSVVNTKNTLFSAGCLILLINQEPTTAMSDIFQTPELLLPQIEPIEAFIWDADGTVLDTRKFILDGIQEAFRAMGHEVVHEAIRPTVGRSLESAFTTLKNVGMPDSAL
jgi:hypothetical protein